LCRGAGVALGDVGEKLSPAVADKGGRRETEWPVLVLLEASDRDEALRRRVSEYRVDEGLNLIAVRFERHDGGSW
jgi:hypothetical protein